MDLLTGCWILEATVLLLSMALLYSTHAYSFWWRRGVPFLWPIPPLGNLTGLLAIKDSPFWYFGQLYKKGAGHKILGIYQMFRPCLMIRNPELIRHVLVKDFAHFTDRGYYFDENLEPLSGHLLNLRGDRWRNMRNKLAPTFTPAKIKSMLPCILDCGRRLQEMKQLATDGTILEIRDIVARYATDVIASCAFGIEGKCMDDPKAEFRLWGSRAFEPSISNMCRIAVMLILPEWGPVLKVRNFSAGVTGFFHKAVKETVEYREKHTVSRDDFLQLLIQLKTSGVLDGDKPCNSFATSGKGEEYKSGIKDTNGCLTEDEIAAQAFLFYLAGFETSSTTMSFCLYELAIHPEIQDRVREEVDAVIERHGGLLTYEGLQEMEYLERVLCETMRKYPALAVLHRVCTKRYEFSGTGLVLEEGQQVLIPTLGLHYDPEHFPDPERFDPDRFTEENRLSRHRYSYLPFGEGPRICLGMRFGMIQNKVAIASLMTRYQFNTCAETKVPVKFDPKTWTLAVAGGLWLLVTQRKD